MFSLLAAQAPGTAIGLRCRALLDVLLTGSQATSVSLVAISPGDGSHRPMASLDYPQVALDYLTSIGFTRHCREFREIVRRPDSLQSWDDVPHFRDTYSAQEILAPAGFRDGISMMLFDADHAVVGVLHLGTDHSPISPETRNMLESVRPLASAWAGLWARFESADLSAREVEVLSLVGEGMPNVQIADRLFIAPRTVTTHVENLLRKLEKANRTELAVLADRYGLVAG